MTEHRYSQSEETVQDIDRDHVKAGHGRVETLIQRVGDCLEGVLIWSRSTNSAEELSCRHLHTLMTREECGRKKSDIGRNAT